MLGNMLRIGPLRLDGPSTSGLRNGGALSSSLGAQSMRENGMGGAPESRPIQMSIHRSSFKEVSRLYSHFDYPMRMTSGFDTNRDPMEPVGRVGCMALHHRPLDLETHMVYGVRLKERTPRRRREVIARWGREPHRTSHAVACNLWHL